MAKKSGGKPAADKLERGVHAASASEAEPTKKRAEARAPKSAKPSAFVDTRVIYCGDNLEQLQKLPNVCVDLVYISAGTFPKGQWPGIAWFR